MQSVKTGFEETITRKIVRFEVTVVVTVAHYPYTLN